MVKYQALQEPVGNLFQNTLLLKNNIVPLQALLGLLISY
jgi:hypothetical protein